MSAHLKDCDGLLLSSLALGTYLGTPDTETDARQLEVILDAVRAGITYIDTAANYRCGRSEKVVGEALAQLAGAPQGGPAVVVGTKAGFLPYIDHYPDAADADYFRSTYIDTGVVKPEWVVGDWQCYHPDYLDWQFEESLRRLRRASVDIFYLHNPEAMVPFLSKAAFRETLSLAFAWGMDKVRAGQIRFLGISTWGGLLDLSPGESLSLTEVHDLAAAAGAQDHFKFIQAPFSAGLTQALTHRTQTDRQGRPLSLVRLAAELGLHLLGSAPLMHGELLKVGCPEELRRLFPRASTMQIYLDFARSCPGLATAIVGTTRQAHLKEAIELLSHAPNPAAFRELFAR